MEGAEIMISAKVFEGGTVRLTVTQPGRVQTVYMGLDDWIEFLNSVRRGEFDVSEMIQGRADVNSAAPPTFKSGDVIGPA